MRAQGLKQLLELKKTRGVESLGKEKEPGRWSRDLVEELLEAMLEVIGMSGRIKSRGGSERMESQIREARSPKSSK